MTNPCFPRRCVVHLLLLLSCLVPFWASVAAAEKQRPNILFVIVDDQSPFDLKAYNPQSQLESPVIDRLAKQGMVLDGAHQMGSWVGAVCTASRHMVMSGRTVWHIPDRGKRKKNPNQNDPKLVPPSLAQNTLPAVFNRAGYDTMRTCKRGNSYDAANKLFQVVRDATKRGPTDESGSPWHAEQVLNYLNEREETKDEDPFFIYMGFSHPHDPRMGQPALLKKYGAVNHADKNSLPPANPQQPRLPENYLPGHPFHHGQPGLRDEEHVPGVWKNRDPVTIRNEIGRQFACSELIDTQIGRVLDRLEEMDQLENTYVFYTSDHGMAIGRHGLQGKQNLYEHTFRVPFIAVGPGIPAGSRALGNVYLLDFLATACDLAGIDAPPTNEGISFRGVLEGKQPTVRDVLYGVYCGGTKPGMRCVKKGNWKIVKFDVLDGTVRETQLFDLATNPSEYLSQHADPKVSQLTGKKPTALQVDLAEDPRYAAKLREMEALLQSEMTRLHDPYKLWDQQ